MAVSPRQLGIGLSGASAYDSPQGIQHETTRLYQEMPSLQSIMRGLTGEADYARMHPLLPVLQAKLSSVSEQYKARGQEQALKDFGLI